MKPIRTLQDERPIISISWENDISSFGVGVCKVTAIVAYGEYGDHDGLATWLAVYEGDEIMHRVPAWQVMISYGKSE